MFRKLPKFEYFKAESFEDAIRILKDHQGNIRPLAGGTDLLVAMKEKEISVRIVLDLKGIKGYDFIRKVDGQIEIGALATIRSIETSPLIRSEIPCLSEAAGNLGSVQVRNRATLGGNLCNAAPSADTAPVLLCLGAKAEIFDGRGNRFISLEEFFVGPGKSVLDGSGLLKKVVVPLLPERSGGVYFKHSPRKMMDLAVVGVGCVLILDRDRKKCIDSRIGLGAVGPVPFRAKKAEAVINGSQVSDQEMEEAAAVANLEAKPITDLRGSAEYRKEMVKFYVKESIREVLRRISSGGGR
jgi:carbon-monoxide dehydrogenase medium subunit